MLRSYIFGNLPIPSEIEEGNIEYKQRLDKKDLFKIKKMASQMLWRLNEGKNICGNYVAHYYIGINDDGSIENLSEDIIDASIKILENVCCKCNAEITFTDKIKINDCNFVAQVSITKYIVGDRLNDARVCFLGPCNHGKTTLVAQITFNQIDDGEGLASSLIHKHIHEKNSGTTSSIKNDIIGLDGENLVNYKSSITGNWEYIINNSKKIISIIDLPGHTKYIKTTLLGLLNNQPHFTIIVISADTQSEEEKIYLKNMFTLCNCLNIPYFVVFTKSDVVGVSKDLILLINNMILYSGKSLIEYNKFFDTNINVPYIVTSNIANTNISQLVSIINDFSTKYNNHNQCDLSKHDMFTIHNNYIIPDKGNILYGIANYGSFSINKKYFIGPILDTFLPVYINTIHKKQLNAKNILNDETASIEIYSHQYDISSLNLKECIMTSNIDDFTITNSLCISIISDLDIEFCNKTIFTMYYKNMCRSVTIIDKHKDSYYIKLNDAIYIAKYDINSLIVLKSNGGFQELSDRNLYVFRINKLF